MKKAPVFQVGDIVISNFLPNDQLIGYVSKVKNSPHEKSEWFYHVKFYLNDGRSHMGALPFPENQIELIGSLTEFGIQAQDLS